MTYMAEKYLEVHIDISYPDININLKFDAKSMGVIALFGPSGSGKTTCLRCIAGLEKSSSGFVGINGTVWQDSSNGVFIPPHKRSIGYVFQDARLFTHLNVIQNLGFSNTKKSTSTKSIDPSELINLLQIEHLLQRSTHHLSGGERQRVAIARALFSDPEVLLLDEPLAALGNKHKSEILTYLHNITQRLNIPVIYVSHSLDEVAQLCDQMVLMEAGQVVATGSTQQIMTRLDLPLAMGDQAGAVVEGVVQSHDTFDHLTLVQFKGGDLLIPLQKADTGSIIRIRIQAKDVSLSIERQQGSSVLNTLSVTVADIRKDSLGQTMVSLNTNGVTLLARVTSRSARLLELTPGKKIFAHIKGVAILN